MFNSRTNKIFRQHASAPETKRDDIGQFLLRIADAIRQSGRREIPRDEQDKILRVIRVLLQVTRVVKAVVECGEMPYRHLFQVQHPFDNLTLASPRRTLPPSCLLFVP